MNNLKRMVLILAVVIVAVVDILIYWDIHLYNKAQEIEDSEKKIIILKKTIDFYPENDLVFYELGRAYFDLGFDNLSNSAQSIEYLQESIKNFKQSLKINPASYFSHFNLAQSFLYLSYLSTSFNISSQDEFKKAAILAGENSQIFYEVAKVFLSRWPELSDEDKDFTLDIMRKIVSGKDKERFLSLLYFWAMNIKDYNVIEIILPENPQIYRIYAKFLGEKSLYLEQRQKYLAKAEFLEFEKAKEEFDLGENEYFYFRLQEAFNHFRSCLGILKKLKFYHFLAQNSPIDHSEFNELQKSASLNLVKCQIEKGEKFEEIEKYLQNYLRLENQLSDLGDFESYLKNRDFIGQELEESFSDLDHLYFEILLYYKQGRYREIMRAGRLLEKSYVVIPEDKKDTYMRILNLIGDSYQKIDYIYDAGEFYQRALKVDPDNLESLVKIRRNYERMNADERIREINERIQRTLSPREAVIKDVLLKKSRVSSQTLILDGRKKVIDLHFNPGVKGITPLITVFFNGRLIWEDYLKAEVLSIPVESELGENSLQIEAVNRTVNIIGIGWRER